MKGKKSLEKVPPTLTGFLIFSHFNVSHQIIISDKHNDGKYPHPHKKENKKKKEKKNYIFYWGEGGFVQTNLDPWEKVQPNVFICTCATKNWHPTCVVPGSES